MSCLHGLPRGFCAICTRTTLNRNFDSPHRVDRREKVVIKIRPNGRMLGRHFTKRVEAYDYSMPSGSTEMQLAAASSSRQGTWQPKSDWGRRSVLSGLRL